MSIDALNKAFAIAGVVSFRMSEDGAVIVDVNNQAATASVSIGGGHLMTWQPRDQTKPVIWLSEQAKVAPGKSIRGGVPVCWPWFGAHASESSFPAHGYARTVPWQLNKTEALSATETLVELTLPVDEKNSKHWPHATPLTLTMIIGKHLKLAMTTHNQGSAPVTITEALHTYFQIGDIGAVSVSGLENTAYYDKVEDFAKKQQQGAINFAGETDRVYVNSAAECVIHDSQLKRRIHIGKSGSQSTIVWTPWVEKAAKMGDLGANEGWRQMLCVESGNALENAVPIAPGASHTLSIDYWAESL